MYNIRIRYDTHLFHMDNNDDRKAQKKGMDMIHCSEDQNTRQDTLEMWEIILNNSSSIPIYRVNESYIYHNQN